MSGVQEIYAFLNWYGGMVRKPQDGSVWTWGPNQYLQAGVKEYEYYNGPFGSYTVEYPMEVVEVRGCVKAAFGTSNGHAVMKDGAVWSWGQNFGDLLWDSSDPDKADWLDPRGPFLRDDISGAVDVLATTSAVFFIMEDGSALATGGNDTNGTGNNVDLFSPTPTEVILPGPIKQIQNDFDGDQRTLFLLEDGALYASGVLDVFNSSGTDFGTDPYYTPEPLYASELPPIVEMSCSGDHVLALGDDGVLYGFGLNYNGALGDTGDDGGPRVVYEDGASLLDFTVTAVTSFIVKSDHTVWATGENSNCEFTFETDDVWNFGFVELPNLEGAARIIGMGQDQIALYPDCSMYLWGRNQEWVIPGGVDSSLDQCEPVLLTLGFEIDPSPPATLIAAGGDSSFMWGTDAYGWGEWNHERAAVIDVDLGGASGMSFASTEGEGGSVNPNTPQGQSPGAAGDAVRSMSVPVPGGGGPSNTFIAYDYYSLGVIRDDGTLWGAGSDSTTLGMPDDVPSVFLQGVQQIEGVELPNVVKFIGDDGTKFALFDDGTLQAWGTPTYWKLGTQEGWDNGSYGYDPSRDPIGGFADIVDVVSGHTHTMLIREDNSVWAWGWNQSGQFGLGPEPGTPNLLWPKFGIGSYTGPGIYLFSYEFIEPTDITDTVPEEVVQIGASFGNSYFLTSSGNIYACGGNSFGELGLGHQWGYTYPDYQWDETNTFPRNRDWFTPQLSNISDVARIWVNGGPCFALKNDGTLWTVGKQNSGEFGNGVEESIEAEWTQVDTSEMPTEDIKEIIPSFDSGTQTFALMNDGTVWGWGYNGDNQLALEIPYTGYFDEETSTYHSGPLDGTYTTPQLTALTNVDKLLNYSGDYFIMLKKDCTLWTWGGLAEELVPARGIDTLYEPTRVTGPFEIEPAPPGTFVMAGGVNSFMFSGDTYAWGGWNGENTAVVDVDLVGG